MDSLDERAKHLSQKLASYYLLFQTCADNVRHLDLTKSKAIYDEVYKKWQDDPLSKAPRNDKEEKASYLAKCDEICRSEPKTAHEYGVRQRSADRAELTGQPEVISRSASHVAPAYMLSDIWNLFVTPTTLESCVLPVLSRKYICFHVWIH
jgi:hypothetical protein